MTFSIKTVLFCLLSFPIFAQPYANPKNSPKKTNTTWKYFDDTSQKSASQLSKDKTALQLSPEDDLQLIKVNEDQLGFRHYRYQQTYKGIPIENAIYLLHEKANRVEHSNGKLARQLDLEVNPDISETTALQAALQKVNAARYAWQDVEHESVLKEIENRPNATFYPDGELVIIDPTHEQRTENFRLAYKFDIYALEPLTRQIVYVDASTGLVMTSFEKIHNCTDIPASGMTNYSDTVDFTACEANGAYTLKNNIGGGMQVYNSNNQQSYPQVPFIESDDFFDNDPTATEVHWATEKTYEYYSDTYARNSMDGNGMALLSWIHYKPSSIISDGYNNAFWNGSWMTYGDGDGIAFSSFTPVDIVAHEMTHGITDFSADLIYRAESGALNESFSDIFGEVVEAYSNPEGNDWIAAGDIVLINGKNGFRNMMNPNDPDMMRQQPDTYMGDYWYAIDPLCNSQNDYCGVHYNSGIQNFWFYLLSQGGSGINDNGDSYMINGIGMTDAAAIAYRNLTTYLTPISLFYDARIGAVQSAEDLFGAGSIQALETAAAWDAVGVSDVPPTLAICRTRDSLILVDFYNATDGANWDPNYVWDLNQPMDNWTGVVLNDYGCVIFLYLAARQITGTIPANLGELSELQYLYLNSNQLTGNIPPELSNLTKLTRFFVYSNQLSGCYPPELATLCSQLDFSENTYISDGNNLDASWEDFCNSGAGVCLPPTCTYTDSLALVALYNATNGANWTNPWNLNQPVDTWQGVTLNADGCVSSLSLASNQISGSIPPELGNLSSLTILDLNGNFLTGSIPPELGNLSNLTDLYLYSNQLSGSIPPELGNLSNLNYMFFGSNQLTGSIPTELVNLNNLISLYLSDNQLTGNIPPELGSLNNLTSLYLDGNQLSGSIPPELGNLNNLVIIYLGNNQLSGCYDIALNNLCNVPAIFISQNNNLDASWTDFCNNGAGGCTSPPSNCTYTDSLVLITLYNATDGANWNNPWNLNQPIDTWQGVTLNADGCVSSLSLVYRQISGSIPPELGNLSSLTILNLYGNFLTGSIPPELGNLTNLIDLYLSENNLTGSIPPELGNLTNLTYLDFSYNDLTGNIPPELGDLTNLTELNFFLNDLTGNIPPELGNLTNLTDMQLNNNNLTGNIPPELGNLSNLTKLVLSGNQLTGSIPPELGNLNNLIHIVLAGNQLSGCYDIALNNLCDVQTLLISPNNNLDANWTDFCDNGAGVCTPPPSACAADSLALIALYNATNGGDWTSPWNLNEPMSSWFGVTLNDDGCVTEISLNYNLLNGTIPPEIGNLSELTTLILSKNQLEGSIPPALGNLSNLFELKLNDNELSGCYDINLSNLCSQLSSEFNNNYYISNNNNFNGSWEAFCYDGESTCAISSCSYTDSLALVALYNAIDGANWTNSWDLSQPMNTWAGLLFDTDGCVNTLNLANKQLVGSIPPEIGNLTSLQRLYLENNQLYGEIPNTIGNLVNLRFFKLNGNQLTGNIPASLGNLSNLYELQLANNDLSGCYDPNLSNLCSIISSNAYISDGNIFDTSWADFCNTGTCAPVWPGDFNNDGIVNADDVLYWGVVENNAGPARPNATDTWTEQPAPAWQSSVNNINTKHQDANGDGIIDIQDLNVMNNNYGNTHTNTTTQGVSPVVFTLEPVSANSNGNQTTFIFDLQVTSLFNIPVNTNGLAGTIDFSQTSGLLSTNIDTTGSSLQPNVLFSSYDNTQNTLDFAMTGTNNIDQLCDSKIASIIVVIEDLQAGMPSLFSISTGNGSMMSGNGLWNTVNGSSISGLLDGQGVLNDLSTYVTAIDEQCNTLGQIIVYAAGGIPPYTYEWSNGENTAQVTDLLSGLYTVTITDSGGLSKVISTQVNGSVPIYDENGNSSCGNTCPAFLAPTNNLTEGLYRADNVLSSDAVILSGSSVEFKAGQIIKLDKGFSIPVNTDFSGEIESCDGN